MELEIQKLLRNNSFEKVEQTLSELEIKYHWEISPITSLEYLHLDYSIFSLGSNLVKECRGLALKGAWGNWDLVRFPFYRFLNCGQSDCDLFEENKPFQVDEKIDGSLLIVCWDEEEGWLIGTRGRIFIRDEIQGFGLTFKDLFNQIFPQDSWQKLNKNYCYMLELTSIESRVVVKYQRNLYLTGIRDRQNDWYELEDEQLNKIAKELNVLRPAQYEFKNINEVIEKVKDLPGTKEGFVIKQYDYSLGRYRRAKVKGIKYLELHRIVTNKSLRSLVSLVIMRDRSCLSDFPEFEVAFDKITEALENYAQQVQQCYNENINLLNQEGIEQRERKKQFAAKVMKTPYGDQCFGLTNGYLSSPWNYFEKQLVARPKILRLIKQLELQKLVDSTWLVAGEDEE